MQRKVRRGTKPQNMRSSKAHQVKAVRFVIGNGGTGVALGAMTSTLGDLVIELSPPVPGGAGNIIFLSGDLTLSLMVLLSVGINATEYRVPFKHLEKW